MLYKRIFISYLDERIKYNKITFEHLVVLLYLMILAYIYYFYSDLRLRLTFYWFSNTDNNILSDIKLLFPIMISIYIMT